MSLKPTLRRLHAIFAHLGLNPLQTLALRHLPAFVRDYHRYTTLAHSTPHAMPLRLGNLFPILTDKSASAGSSTSHYFQMDLYMARRVIAAAPKSHLDIGSRLDGFIGHLLAAAQPVTMVDIRPLPTPPVGLQFQQDNATTLASFADKSVPSLSSLHAAEHFGLGRYGDPIDPTACYAFMRNMARVLAKDGKLYFATPVGEERLEFNAHRVFSPHTLHRLFVEECGLALSESALITTHGKLLEDIDPRDFPHENFGCGLYIFTRK
jgi:hypothetical protein